MKTLNSNWLSFLLILLWQGINAQELLTLEDAIRIGLEKNYDVQIAKNYQEIARVQNNIGNAGMTPTLTLNANLTSSNINSHQEFNTGVVQDRNGALANNAAASINADWTIFDGFRMFSIKKRLSQNEQLYGFQLKQQMETTVYNIIVAYYDIVRIMELIKAAKQNLAIYEERKKIAELKLAIGSDSKVDLLLAKSDVNTARSSIIQLELQLLTTKTNLNSLINKPVDTEFTTVDSIIINTNLVLEDLKKTVISSNSFLQISRQNELIAHQLVKEVRANNLPFVQLHGAYNFTRSQSQAGIVFLNRQLGLTGGISASWLLFNGNRNNNLSKERSLLFLNQKYITEQTKIQVDALVYINYKAFLMNKQMVDLEILNMADSREVLNVSLERYKIGKSGVLETIETQKNLEDAQVRFINALYSTKIAETELLRANGNLVK